MRETAWLSVFEKEAVIQDFRENPFFACGFFGKEEDCRFFRRSFFDIGMVLKRHRTREMNAIELEQAIDLLLEQAFEIREYEETDILQASGRILAETICAPHDQPPFPRSPLDGYAVRSEDIRDASPDSPAELKVIDEVDAGHMTEKAVTPGTAIRIMTGAPIPEGADCILKQEDTDYGETTVKVFKPLQHLQNYCCQGEDYRKGAILFEQGDRLGPVEIGVLAGLNRKSVKVYRRPRVLVMSTGDEIAEPGTSLLPGQIYDSNLHMLLAQLADWKVEIADSTLMGDNPAEAAEWIDSRIGEADLVITTGGVSVGKKDIMHDVFRILGVRQMFWGVDIKPGMPTLCGKYRDRLLICLSGNPYGAIANLHLLVKPVLAKMTGREDLRTVRISAYLEGEFGKKSPVRRFVRAKVTGHTVRLTDGSNDSGVLSSMCRCNCMVEIPAGSGELKAGEKVKVVLL